MRKLLFAILVLSLPAAAQWGRLSNSQLSGRCDPRTLGLDVVDNIGYTCGDQVGRNPPQWAPFGSVTQHINVIYPNSANGTVCNELAKVDPQSGSTTMGRATVTAGGELFVLGVAVAGCGTSNNATIAFAGEVPVIFDSATPTLGDAVGISATAGLATDLGSANPTTSSSIIGVVILSPSNTQPSGCTVAPGCWILLGPAGGGGGGGGAANAVVTNPATTLANTVQSIAATAQPITTKCPASAANTLDCFQVQDNNGNQVLGVQQNGTVQLGSGTTHNFGSRVAGNSDLNGTLTMVGGTGTYPFTGSYASHPTCIASDETAIAAVKVTYTGTTSVTFTTSGSTDVVDYHCLYRN